MRKLVAVENLSLDGVMQAPGRPDEDVRGGFAHGGWAGQYNDEVKGRLMAAGMADSGPLLFGRRTYEDFFKVWPGRTDNPFTAVLDNTQKFVASRTLAVPLPWQNSTLLEGDVAAAVARLKQQPGGNLVVLGSGDLMQTLLRHHLVDELVLLIHPLTLGAGRRLFEDSGTFERFTLADSQPTTTGVIISSYRRLAEGY
jgi:dihydrofolate reductase